MSYNHFLFWNPAEKNPMEKIGNVLESIYANSPKKLSNLNKSADRIEIVFKDYKFIFVYVDSDFVKEESEDIASNFAKKRKDKSIIKESRQRIEFYGDDDFEMKYFNEYLLILEKIQSQLSLIIFDTVNGKFFEEF